MGTLAEQLQVIGLLGVGFTIPAQLFLLVLQADAYRRYRHASFVRLVVASVLLISSTVIWSLPMVSSFALPESAMVTANWIGLALSMAGMAVAIWGAATLFRSYGELLAAKGAMER